MHIHFALSTLQFNAKISWNDFFSHNTPLITAWVNEMQFLYKKIKIKAKRNTFLLLTSYKKSNQPKYINAAMP